MTLFLSDPFEWGTNPGMPSVLKIHTLAMTDAKNDELILISQEKVANIMAESHHATPSLSRGALTNNISQIAGDLLHIPETFQACTLDIAKEQVVQQN